MSHTTESTYVPIVHSDSVSIEVAPVIQILEQLIEAADLSLKLQVTPVERKLSQKVRQQLSDE